MTSCKQHDYIILRPHWMSWAKSGCCTSFLSDPERQATCLQASSYVFQTKPTYSHSTPLTSKQAVYWQAVFWLAFAMDGRGRVCVRNTFITFDEGVEPSSRALAIQLASVMLRMLMDAVLCSSTLILATFCNI